MSRRISSATEKALELVSQGRAVSAAALEAGVNRSTLFRALDRLQPPPRAHAARTLIVGAGALGREVARWMRRADPDVSLAFLDDGVGMTAAQEKALGIVGPVLASSVGPGDTVLVAIADPAARERVGRMFEGALMPSFLDPSCIWHGSAIEAGCILLPNTLLSENVRLGLGVILNTYSSIGHDCTVGDFCTLSSYVALCGRVTVGKRVFFGCGAKVLPGVSIGDDAVIGAGALVMRNVAAGETVFGVPARVI